MFAGRWLKPLRQQNRSAVKTSELALEFLLLRTPKACQEISRGLSERERAQPPGLSETKHSRTWQGCAFRRVGFREYAHKKRARTPG